MTAQRQASKYLRLTGAVTMALLSASSALGADSPWLYGIHWVGSSANHSDLNLMTGSKAIWTLETVMTHDGYGQWGPQGQISKFQYIVNNMGYTIITRVQPVWGKAFPLPGDTDPDMNEFLDEVTYTAQLYRDLCHIWHLGNEMNLTSEWGDQELLPEDYIDAAVQFSDRIKAVTSSLGPQIVLVGPACIGDDVGGGKFMGCTEYINRMCDHINDNDYQDKFDGFAMHAYGNPYYTNINQILPLFETDVGSGYQYQVGLLDAKGFAQSPVYITEWNRYTGSTEQEYASAQFLHTALTRMNTWNQNPANHPIVCACWFIYPIDPVWSEYSLLGLKSSGDQDHDLWHAFQYAAGFNYLATYPNRPEIELSESQFSHSINAGESLPNDTFTVRNFGGRTLDYSISVVGDPAWIHVDPTTGSSTGEADTINVIYTTATLVRGTYNATIRVSGNGHNSPQDIAVTLEVAGVPGDFDVDGDVDVEDFGFMQVCFSGSGVHQAVSECLAADLNGDGDVDGGDLDVFKGCMSGANVPGSMNCAD